MTAQGTVYHAAQAAGVSRWTAYRWRRDDLEFASLWDEAIENAVDAVESVIYQQAVGGNTLAAIFYLKAHRPKYRDRVTVDLELVDAEIEERMQRLGIDPQRLFSSLGPGDAPELKLLEAPKAEAGNSTADYLVQVTNDDTTR